MLMLGEFKEIIDAIYKEYGSDVKVCLQLYSDLDEEELIAADYLFCVKQAEDGTVYLMN